MKTQKTLDSYFKGNKSTDLKDSYEIKKYFYLIWDNKFTPNMEAYWTSERPEKINFIEQVFSNYVKKGYYFYICGYFTDYDDEKKYNLTKEIKYKNISYLKSHLQKCIRKGDDTLAIPTGNHLCKLDLNEVLRRLPIIMLEDTTLHKSFSTLIWLMIAVSTKKFKMQKYIYEWIYGLIYVLCKIDKKDNIIEKTDTENMKEKKSIVEIFDSYNELSKEELSILYSIHLRISYGGNESDLKMLEEYSKLWYNRLINKKMEFNKMNIRPISIYVKNLELNDWDLSAIDYHCNPKLLEYISKKYDTLDLEEIKKIIWFHSSSINYRCMPNNYDVKNWNLIKDYVLKTQKYLLNC